MEKRRLLKLILVIPIVTVTLLAGRAQAQGLLVTGNFTGMVTAINGDPGLLGGAIAVGNAITGSFTYSTTATDTDPSPSVANYSISSPPGALSVTISGPGGAFTYSHDPSLSPAIAVNVINDSPNDFFSVSGFGSAGTFPFFQGLAGSLIFQAVSGPEPSLLTSDALPTSLFLSGGSSALFVIDANAPAPSGVGTVVAYQVVAAVTGITLVTTPLPVPGPEPGPSALTTQYNSSCGRGRGSRRGPAHPALEAPGC